MIARMCRLLAFRSTLPVGGRAALCERGNSLAAQSRRDARGESHVDGWGLASFDDGGEPRIAKSLQPAFSDPAFDKLAKSVVATALVAHVRQASVGRKALVNTHPFAHGRWVFAHNGTLQDFAARKGPLLDAVSDDLRPMIRGDTDSEHAFLFWLSQLRAAAGGLDKSPGVDTITSAFQRTIKLLDGWFPAHNGEESKMTFVATDGRLLAATRWGHALSCLECRGGGTGGGRACPLDAPGAFHAVCIASEATDGDSWREVPDRSLLVVDERLQMHAASLA
jgi:predicted glutamine amidotransferase